MKHFPPLLFRVSRAMENECKAGHQAGTGSVQRSVQGQWPAWCLRNIFHPSFLGSFLGNRVSTRLRARSVCRLVTEVSARSVQGSGLVPEQSKGRGSVFYC